MYCYKMDLRTTALLENNTQNSNSLDTRKESMVVYLGLIPRKLKIFGIN